MVNETAAFAVHSPAPTYFVYVNVTYINIAMDNQHKLEYNLLTDNDFNENHSFGGHMKFFSRPKRVRL